MGRCGDGEMGRYTYGFVNFLETLQILLEFLEVDSHSASAFTSLNSPQHLDILETLRNEC